MERINKQVIFKLEIDGDSGEVYAACAGVDEEVLNKNRNDALELVFRLFMRDLLMLSFDEIQRCLSDALKGTGYVLNYIEVSSPDMFGEQELRARFHRNPLTVEGIDNGTLVK